tara:strand:- start:1115 stop:2134 length:1020 start_codon:yes stop_codon:yes gene_type:complete
MKAFESRFAEEELGEVRDVLLAGNLGFGENVSRLEDSFKDFSGKSHNVATNSASAAAFMIFAFLREKYGTCDVYTTSLGFVSPAWAANHHGHNVLFVDVNDELLFDMQDYAKRRVRSANKVVLMPVLYGGVSEIENWQPAGDEIVVVDSAHCVTPKIKCDFSFFSFHPYKPICSSDGGMISTDDKDASNFFRLYRNFGRVPQKEGGYDIHASGGFKFYMNNLNATLALASMKRYDDDLLVRKRNFQLIRENLPLTNMINHVTLSSYYFGVCFSDNADKIMNRLGLTRHYPMLHMMTHFDNNHRPRLNNLESMHGKIVNIPIHQHLTEKEVVEIVRIIGE